MIHGMYETHHEHKPNTDDLWSCSNCKRSVWTVVVTQKRLISLMDQMLHPELKDRPDLNRISKDRQHLYEQMIAEDGQCEYSTCSVLLYDDTTVVTGKIAISMSIKIDAVMRMEL